MIEPQINIEIPELISYQRFFEGQATDVVHGVLAIIFILTFVVFISTLIITAYHLRRYSLTQLYAIKAEVLYLMIAFLPLAVMVSILINY